MCNIDLVSVIIPTYNSSKTIQRTLKSVVNQTYGNIEIILVDDKSSDNTLEVVCKMEIPNLKVIRKPVNSGVAISRNIGIAESTGKYIAFLDSDDEWLPLKLESQISYMIENKIGFSYTNYLRNDNGKIKEVKCPQKVSYGSLLKRNPIGCLTVVYDTTKIGKVSIVDLEKRNDYALWLKILNKTDFGYLLNQTLAIYNCTSNSISSGSKISLIKYHYIMFRFSEDYSICVSIMFTLRNVFYHLFEVLKERFSMRRYEL